MRKILSAIARIGRVSSRGKEYYDSIVPIVSFDPTGAIEKNIHQTYHKQELPSELADNVLSLKHKNPDYHYTLWDDKGIEVFIQNFYGAEILTYYKRINPAYGAARADFFRYLVVYMTGGVYLDIKSSLEYPLKDILQDSDLALLAHWDNWEGSKHEGYGLKHCHIKGLERGEFIQWALVFKAGHPILRKVIIGLLESIDSYDPIITGVGQSGVLNTTGPILYTKVLYDALKDKKVNSLYRLVELPEVGLVYSIYESLNLGVDHKSTVKNNYTSLLSPVVKSAYSIVDDVVGVLYRLYAKILSLINTK